MIKVAVIEDNNAYRKALQTLITHTTDLELVFSASNCNNIKEIISAICPDVFIMDIDMPGINGIEGVRLVKEHCPEANVFMLTVFEDDDNIFESIKAGAIGYLLKKDPPEEILEAVRKVYRGESVMNGKIARKLLQYFSKQDPKEADFSEYNLTPREKEILEHLMKGLSYKEIALKCFVSLDTIFSHIRKIYSKLNVHSRAEITAKFR